MGIGTAAAAATAAAATAAGGATRGESELDAKLKAGARPSRTSVDCKWVRDQQVLAKTCTAYVLVFSGPASESPQPRQTIAKYRSLTRSLAVLAPVSVALLGVDARVVPVRPEEQQQPHNEERRPR